LGVVQSAHQVIELFPTTHDAKFAFTFKGGSDFELSAYCIWGWQTVDGNTGFKIIRKFSFEDEARKCWDLVKKGVPIETVREICFT